MNKDFLFILTAGGAHVFTLFITIWYLVHIFLSDEWSNNVSTQNSNSAIVETGDR